MNAGRENDDACHGSFGYVHFDRRLDPDGKGRCAVCKRVFKLSWKGLLPRHGFTRRADSGTGEQPR
jgi:hypothetical protein